MDKTRFAFFGTTNYSKELLIYLIDKGYIPSIIFSIPEEFNISYSNQKIKNSNHANIKGIADKYKIDYYEIDSCKEKRLLNYKNLIRDLNLDLILVLGWYYMIPEEIINFPKHGTWGIHASLLPKYAGGAPLNWAIINGEEKTGVTLFRLDNGVDSGDIIEQKEFSIEFEDSIKDVYKKATIASKEMLSDALGNIENVRFIPQKKSEIEIYPQRKPNDGQIDLTKNSIELYNFIRAQSTPYPGAYIKTIDGKKLIIEKARLEEL